MKQNHIFIIVGVVAVVGGISYHFYKQKKERDAVEMAKKKALAEIGVTSSAQPTLSTPGISPTGVTGGPTPGQVLQPVGGDDVMQTM